MLMTLGTGESRGTSLGANGAYTLPFTVPLAGTSGRAEVRCVVAGTVDSRTQTFTIPPSLAKNFHQDISV